MGVDKVAVPMLIVENVAVEVALTERSHILL